MIRAEGSALHIFLFRAERQEEDVKGGECCADAEGRILPWMMWGLRILLMKTDSWKLRLYLLAIFDSLW